MPGKKEKRKEPLIACQALFHLQINPTLDTFESRAAFHIYTFNSLFLLFPP